MGFRFRKSINLGGGFRVNLSKSGVGYSFGSKGFRYTKKAGGGTRTTASIPGTGLSYVHESNKKRSNSGGQGAANHTPAQTPTVEQNTYDTQEIKNASVKNMVSEGLEEMLAAANESLKYYSMCSVSFWVFLILGCLFPLFWIVSVTCAVYGIWLTKNAAIVLEYTFDDDQAAKVAERISPLQKIANSKKVWYISQYSRVIDKKYAAGASNTVKRNPCKVTTKAPFPFKTSTKVFCFKVGKETLVFLPDKLFVFQKGKIGALNYSDVITKIHDQQFIEREAVPRDAKIIDYTWQYVNKSGGPDKRFQDNKKLPICLYGELEIRSTSGLNTDIIFSNIGI